MIESLKEMGEICENRKLSVLIQDFHRQRFKELFDLSPEKAEKHRKDYLWWTERIAEIDKHLEQLHERIKRSA